MLVKLFDTCMCFLCNSQFKSSLELMLCVIDISTLNKTYLIFDPGHLHAIFVNLKKRRFVSTNIYLGYLLPFSCTQLFIINKSISPYRSYLTTLIFIKFIELCIPFAVLGLYSNNVEAKTRKSKRDVMFGLKVRLIPSLCIEVPVPSQWSCNCICV